MDMLVDYVALQRRATTRTAMKVLEAAVAEALGFPVALRGVQLWISPTLLDEGRVPERYMVLADAPRGDSEALPGPDYPLRVQSPTQPLLPHFRDWQDVPSARELVRRRREKRG